MAQCVRDIPQLDQAFATYERLRRARAEKVVRVSRRTGNNKAASNQVARWLRDLMMPFFLKRLANSAALDWLYSYKVAWHEAVTQSA